MQKAPKPAARFEKKAARVKRRPRFFGGGRNKAKAPSEQPEGAFETVHLFSIIASPSGDEALRSGRAAPRHTRRPA